MTEDPTTGRDPREDEDDLDLLTYIEAGIRLSEEIARTNLRIEAAKAADAPAADISALVSRLADLEAAQNRNSRPALDDTSFEEFFGYPAERRD